MLKTSKCWLEPEWRALKLDNLQSQISKLVWQVRDDYVDGRDGVAIPISRAQINVGRPVNHVKNILVQRLQALDMRGRRWLS